MSVHCNDECVDFWKSRCEFLQRRVDVLESIVEEFLEKILELDGNAKVYRETEGCVLQEKSSCS